VIALLERHKARHSESYYYEVRAQVPRDPIARAARIIFLNKTCYNGLYRENRKGEFNAPFGRYKNPAICDADNLRAVAKALQRAKIECRHFDTVAKHAKKGDLVYFDPPYHPVSKTSSFTGYDKSGFNEDSQRLLAKDFAALADRGVKVLLSNSMTELIRELYTGFTIDEVQARRNVNSRPDRRGPVAEALIRNF
jgi:DNA adenine methylase